MCLLESLASLRSVTANSVIGFSRPECHKEHGPSSFMVAVRRAPSGAPDFPCGRSTNLRTAATHRLVATGVGT
ncbi:hypothetical protein EUX53_23525 [Pseudomonas orientalis]|uniref:Uncharacterized protein n=1 Tax=Pseudomonas orientalis TaxID=76758 RepID=A0A4Q7CZF5_9PSED|nr:hypothetical protein EUX53_23525 [Pseudomonas orientalis]RZI30777.1 hypothetical protein EUX57_15765 [Pseudomonas orientalis]